MSERARPRLLLSALARARLAARLAGQADCVTPDDAARGAAFDVALVSRDVTGLSTKQQVLPDTAAFYAALQSNAALAWVHVHSAGVDRPVYVALRERGVRVSTSAGCNATVVAHSAMAGVLALARRLPALMAAQRERRWAPLIGSGLPPDLDGQTALVVGWGAIGQRIGALLRAFGLQVIAVRRERGHEHGQDGVEFIAYDDLAGVLPRADWLILACPLTPRTRGLVDGSALAQMPASAHLINVARGELVHEAALVDALRHGRLAGAFLDVFAQEPLPDDSPLWALPNVIATPHSAGFSDGNEARVDALFLDNLRRWRLGLSLENLAGDPGR